MEEGEIMVWFVNILFTALPCIYPCCAPPAYKVTESFILLTNTMAVKLGPVVRGREKGGGRERARESTRERERERGRERERERERKKGEREKRRRKRIE